jgi:hypothetical protein
MRVTGTRSSIASRFAESPKGTRNSSRRISPGCTGLRRIFPPFEGSSNAHCGAPFKLRVVDDLDIVRAVPFPSKADARVADEIGKQPGPAFTDARHRHAKLDSPADCYL